MSKEDIYKKLGKNIKKFREEKHFSQEDLAYKISSARNYIGCIERGEKHPSLTIIYKIAQALEKEVKDLVEGF